MKNRSNHELDVSALSSVSGGDGVTCLPQSFKGDRESQHPLPNGWGDKFNQNQAQVKASTELPGDAAHRWLMTQNIGIPQVQKGARVVID